MDQKQLQDDLASLEVWASRWGMKFNASKCYVMSIHRDLKPYTKFYQLNGQILQQVSENPYLGLTIRDDLQWSSHISKTCAKASSTIGFIRITSNTATNPSSGLHIYVSFEGKPYFSIL